MGSEHDEGFRFSDTNGESREPPKSLSNDCRGSTVHRRIEKLSRRRLKSVHVVESEVLVNAFASISSLEF